jgi:hypothetical protein
MMNKPTVLIEKIDRDQVLSRYWELANLDPETTKGSIAGQLKALDSLCEELRLTSADQNKKTVRVLPAQEIYRSAWMADPRPTN